MSSVTAACLAAVCSNTVYNADRESSFLPSLPLLHFCNVASVVRDEDESAYEHCYWQIGCCCCKGQPSKYFCATISGRGTSWCLDHKLKLYATVRVR